MADPLPRGVLGKDAISPVADGTLMRRLSALPGVTGAPATDPDRDAFARWARLEAWTGAWMMEGYTFAGKHGLAKPTSGLSGAFLRMYLRHRVDPAVIAQAGQEIAASDEWKALSGEVELHLNDRAANTYKRPLTALEIGKEARDYLLMAHKHGGIAFRGRLNPVIGGISGIEVAVPARLLPSADGTSYELQVTLKDEYDFDNDRKSHAAYDGLRRRWARQLAVGQFSAVKWNYHRELYFNTTGIGRTFVFAAFLYAIEKAGMTPGPLSWEATIPMTGCVGGKVTG